MKFSLAAILLILLLLPSEEAPIDLPKHALKKVDKTLEAFWPEQQVAIQLITLDEQRLQDMALLAKDVQLFHLQVAAQTAGYLYISEANSKFETFTYMTIYNPDLSIKTIQVLIYREDYGGEIGSKRWLRQFTDKKEASDMEFGKDIKNISGATISCRSITNGVQEQTKQMQAFKASGMLP